MKCHCCYCVKAVLRYLYLILVDKSTISLEQTMSSDMVPFLQTTLSTGTTVLFWSWKYCSITVKVAKNELPIWVDITVGYDDRRLLQFGSTWYLSLVYYLVHS